MPAGFLPAVIVDVTVARSPLGWIRADTDRMMRSGGRKRLILGSSRRNFRPIHSDFHGDANEYEPEENDDLDEDE
jgi:hypothetical protein